MSTLLAPTDLITAGAYLDGAVHTPTGHGVIDTLDPADGSCLASIPVCGPDTVGDAVSSSEQALTRWRQCLPMERSRILQSISRKIIEQSALLARVESLDTGKPLREAARDVAVAARYFEFYAGAADKVHGESLPLGPQLQCHTVLEPLGVTAHVVPWNYPLTQAARGLAPALAAGCTAILKPAEQTPLTSLLLARLMVDAGLPAGVCNVVCGAGAVTGAALVAHPGVAHVAFTGSVATGKAVMKSAADHVASVTLELGGKSPLVVLDDADQASALQGVLRGIFTNCGQICSAGSRLVIQRGIAEQFLQRLLDKVSGFTYGRGLDDPDLGPLVSRTQLEKIATMVDRSISDGAVALAGGKRMKTPGLENGYFYPATVLRVDDPACAAAQEEFFGPVLAVQVVDDFEQALEVSNNSRYGLVAGIYTSNLGKAQVFSRDVVAGQVFLNGFLAGGVETPFGGARESGIGREKGMEGLRSYLRSKTIVASL